VWRSDPRREFVRELLAPSAVAPVRKMRTSTIFLRGDVDDPRDQLGHDVFDQETFDQPIMRCAAACAKRACSLALCEARWEGLTDVLAASFAPDILNAPRGRGGIGRRAGLRVLFPFLGVQVRPLSPAFSRIKSRARSHRWIEDRGTLLRPLTSCAALVATARPSASESSCTNGGPAAFRRRLARRPLLCSVRGSGHLSSRSGRLVLLATAGPLPVV
jgi:hypothetical protein